jgi:hypothetical protein
MTIKYLARRIYKKHGILLDVNYILSRGKYKVSQEHYDLVIRELPILEQIDNILLVQDLPKNPTGIWNDLLKLANDNGVGIEKADNGNYQFIQNVDYKPKNPNLNFALRTNLKTGPKIKTNLVLVQWIFFQQNG